MSTKRRGNKSHSLKAFAGADHDSARPLRGVVICATGIALDKEILFKQAEELGATCTLALTDRVAHLIALDHGGDKYTCALERGIPIVRPSWIGEACEIWLRGDDADAEASVQAHRLPIAIPSEAGVVVVDQ